jgi:anthranilate synthase component 1
MDIVFQQKAKWLDNDLQTVIGLFLKRLAGGDSILLESAAVDGRWGRFSLAGGDFLLIAACCRGRLQLTIKDERLVPLRQYEGLPYLEGLRHILGSVRIARDTAMPAFPAITRGLYGYLGYGTASLMEKKLLPLLPPAEAEGVMVLPATLYLFDHTYNQLAQISLLENIKVSPGSPAGACLDISAAVPSFDRRAYVAAAARIRELIRQGQAMQVVLSCAFSIPFQGELFPLYRRLRQINPSPYMFFMRAGDFSMAVSSPEVMITCDHNRLRLCPIAGTRPRGKDKGEDNLFEQELASDSKERAEHVMLVDLGRNDLGRVAETGSVRVDRFMEVERFSHVMHLTTHLSARLATGFDALDVIGAAFPAGTLSGAPKVRAMEIIAEFEPTARGPYGGALGWLGLDRDAVNLDLGITIRGMWRRSGRLFWQAGAGLVYDSDPEREWLECQHKLAVMAAALTGGV